MPHNEAAWLPSKGGTPLKVGPAEMPTAGPGQLVLRNRAVAMNPIGWKMQYGGLLLEKFPALFGYETAGEVVEVGAGVKDFRVGDRVLSYTNAGAGSNFSVENAAYQSYTRVEALLTSKLPSNLTFTQATVLPLALATASDALYSPKKFSFPLPSVDPEPSSDKIALLWGGSSAVGIAAIQLAKASGIEVVSTASARNLALLQSIGADHVFDHQSPSVVDDIVSAIKSSGKDFAGVFDAVSTPESIKLSAAVPGKLGSGSRKLLHTVPVDKDSLPHGIEPAWVFAPEVYTNKRLAEAIFGDFVPAALESGKLKALPEALVVGKGLDAIQKGIDTLRAGVSARKVVVEL